MNKVTVMIPTSRRPELLKTTLQSLQWQSANSRIDRILVSEHGGDDASAEVCRLFKDLPITYVKQATHNLSMAEHWAWILTQAQSEYTAMIHDDDWWYPTHLECALRSLDTRGTEAYFSNYVLCTNEISKGASPHHPSIISYLVGDRALTDTVLLDFRAIAMLCFLYTPFHSSSLVCKSSAMKYAAPLGLKDAKPWYVDRILYPLLAADGMVEFNPQFLCGVRVHSRSFTSSTKARQNELDHIEGGLKIARFAASRGLDVIGEWKAQCALLSASEIQYLVEAYRSHTGEIFPGIPLDRIVVGRTSSLVKRLIKNALPLGLVKIIRNRH